MTTFNGGEAWSNQVSGSVANFYDVCFVDSNHGWAVGYIDDQGVVFATSNGGETWTEQIRGLGSILYGVAFVDPLNGWVVGDIYWVTHNGGSTWEPRIGGNFRDIFFLDAEHGWIVGRYGIWGKYLPEEDVFLFSVGQLSTHWQGVSFVDPDHGWLVGGYGVIVATSDGGQTWTYQTSGVTSLTGVSFVDQYHGWAVGDFVILTTSDGGNTWVKETSEVEAQLRDVFFVDLTHGWAAGWPYTTGKGTILKYTPTVSRVDIDVKPATEPNNVNLKSKGLLPVAILGSSSFDVTAVNPATINIGVVQLASRGSAKTPKLAYSLSDVNSDGYLDLVANFEIQALVNAGVLTPTTVTLTLKANLYDTTPIEGTDSANIVPR